MLSVPLDQPGRAGLERGGLRLGARPGSAEGAPSAGGPPSAGPLRRTAAGPRNQVDQEGGLPSEDDSIHAISIHAVSIRAVSIWPRGGPRRSLSESQNGIKLNELE